MQPRQPRVQSLLPLMARMTSSRSLSLSEPQFLKLHNEKFEICKSSWTFESLKAVDPIPFTYPVTIFLEVMLVVEYLEPLPEVHHLR